MSGFVPEEVGGSMDFMSGFVPEEEGGSMDFLSGEVSNLSVAVAEEATTTKTIKLEVMTSWAAKFNVTLKAEGCDDSQLIKEEQLINMIAHGDKDGDSALSLEEFMWIFLRCASARLNVGEAYDPEFAEKKGITEQDGNWAMFLVNTFPKVDQIGREAIQYIGRKLHVVGTEEILGKECFDTIVTGNFEMPDEQEIPEEEEFDEDEEEM